MNDKFKEDYLSAISIIHEASNVNDLKEVLKSFADSIRGINETLFDFGTGMDEIWARLLVLEKNARNE